MTSSESQPRTPWTRYHLTDGVTKLTFRVPTGTAMVMEQAGWNVTSDRIEAEAAQDSRPLDVERLARALDLWERRADPEDENISALLGVDIYENGSVEVAQGIVAEYASLAAEEPHA